MNEIEIQLAQTQIFERALTGRSDVFRAVIGIPKLRCHPKRISVHQPRTDRPTEALTHLSHALLPGLIAQRGAILNLSSLAGDLPIPDFAVYAATKAYVSSFSEALRLELRSQGVRVLAVCPGPIKTGFGDTARRGSTTKLPVQETFYVPATHVVRDSLQALINDRPRVYPGLKVAAVAGLISLLPLAVVRLVMNQRPRKSE